MVRTGDSHSSNRGSIPLGASGGTVAILALESGELFAGWSCGAPPLVVGEPYAAMQAGGGEVVINTAMVGYPEVLTDCSYTQQLVVMTYPACGNYGVDSAWSESQYRAVMHGGDAQLATEQVERVGETRQPEPAAQSQQSAQPQQQLSMRNDIQLAGLVMHTCYDGALLDGRAPLAQYLHHNGVPAIVDVDTRALTLAIRSSGATFGAIVAAPAGFERWDDIEAIDSTWKHAVGDTLRHLKHHYRSDSINAIQRSSALYQSALAKLSVGANVANGKTVIMDNTDTSTTADTDAARQQSAPPHDIRVAIIDCGYKKQIVSITQRLVREVCVVDSYVTAEQILALKPDVVLVTNGPGDPAALDRNIATVQRLIGKVPLFGICMGHQIISLALGASTKKMEFGHHGINHPVLCTTDNRVYVSSQNHEFVVTEQSLPAQVKVWFTNLNDGTLEGIIDSDRMVYSVQFHPEAAPGPLDCRWLFSYVYGEVERTRSGASSLDDVPSTLRARQ